MGETKVDRATKANELLAAIASCGRRFFAHQDRVSRFEVDSRGRIWLIDKYTQKRIYTHYSGDWRGFSDGGTLHGLVCRLRDFIAKGQLLRASTFGPWPEWICGGDLWGYGEAMGDVRAAAARLGIVAPPNPPDSQKATEG